MMADNMENVPLEDDSHHHNNTDDNSNSNSNNRRSMMMLSFQDDDDEEEEASSLDGPVVVLDDDNSFPHRGGGGRRSRNNGRGRHTQKCGIFTFVGITVILVSVMEVLRSDRFLGEGGGGNRTPHTKTTNGGGGGYGAYNNDKKKTPNNHHSNRPVPVTSIVPDQLMGSLYQPSDFINERGVIPTFWNSYDDLNNNNNNNSDTMISTNTSSSSSSSSIRIASKTANALQITTKFNHNGIPSWGPCYPPQQRHSGSKSNTINWNHEIIHAQQLEPQHEYRRNQITINSGIDNMCRPGFIIIGAGKCGTSSLYHYLIGHPRILPAYSKQIHYFVYNPQKSLSWYYSWFPTTTNFLASGALMTGEASPGYLPYPKVAKLMHTSLPDPKIIMVGRNPLERSWSSYKYNYVTPTLAEMVKGHVKGLLKRQTEEYYKTYLFTFEELMRAELIHLKACLDPIHGFGANATRAIWGKKQWTQPELDHRMTTPNEKSGVLQPLIDLDEVCYGDKVNRTVLREQWAELQMSQPHKVMIERNLHLKQSLIGRSLYVFPLEWWYMLYKSTDIHFICTEELSDMSGHPLNEMAVSHLGLPFFNFSSVVAQGAYNVGDNRGYNKATSWEEVSVVEGEGGAADDEENNDDDDDDQHSTSPENEVLPGTVVVHSEEDEDSNISSNSSHEKISATSTPSNSIVIEGSDIPLSDELLQELKDFIHPINERLFALIGKRCDW